ncbi:MAG: hypothetical protein EBS20_00595 [Actinobacteria bacterium]|nr:hypothetical protein [Actinomycetota bacterium]
MVVGIGPAVQRLCEGVGIRTWWDLANTPIDDLRSMLGDAGPRFGMHDPTTWPLQARLLAEGRWAEFHAIEGRSTPHRASRRGVGDRLRCGP